MRPVTQIWFLRYLRFAFGLAPRVYLTAAACEVLSDALRLCSITLLMGVGTHMLAHKTMFFHFVGPVDVNQPVYLMALSLGFIALYALAGLCHYVSNTILFRAKDRHLAFIAAHAIKPSTRGNASLYVSRIISRSMVFALMFLLMILLVPGIGIAVSLGTLAAIYGLRGFIMFEPREGVEKAHQENHIMQARQRWVLAATIIQAVVICAVLVTFVLENKNLEISIARILLVFFVMRTGLSSMQTVFVNLQQLYKLKPSIMKELAHV